MKIMASIIEVITDRGETYKALHEIEINYQTDSPMTGERLFQFSGQAGMGQKVFITLSAF